MKPGTPPPSPDDDASDPLLAALRQRLGDYGQAPPPAAWAAIRQRLPLAPVRPWWRRPRRLLPLLALLLSLVAAGVLTEQRGLRPGSAGQRGRPVAVARPLAGQLPGGAPTGAARPPARAARPAAAAGQPTAQELLPATSVTALRLAEASALRTSAALAATKSRELNLAEKGLLGHSINSKKLAALPKKSASSHHHAASKPATYQEVADRASTASNRRRHHKYLAFGTGLADSRRRESARYLATRPALAADASLPAGAATAALAAVAPKARQHQTYATAAKRREGQKPLRSAPSLPTTTAQVAGRRSRAPLGGALGPLGLAAASPASRRYPALGAAAADTMGTAATGAAVDSLALGRPALVLPPAALPAALVAAADSGRPAARPGRRWSVLLVAGPTLSYRTLGPAPTLAAGQPDFARLERPALGFGAQVQGRRVLSGRWAVAVGVGYHEYATRLALSRKDSAYTSLNQRDTYRLLTVPVQLSYALGAPKGRFSKALLLGLEPGWYLGGRSTEGSTCSCQQQAYASAASSPYRSLSLAVSLGLDVRYRLGSAGSRWQWLVQPTGRYVATPFVRSDAVGFTRRQPFSLGLLTGFSWDLR